MNPKQFIKVFEKDYQSPYKENSQFRKDPVNYSLNDEEEIAVVKANKIALIYPIKVLRKHIVIPLKHKGKDITITYCSNSDCILLYLGKWGVSGLFYKSNMVLYNKENDVLVPQILGFGFEEKRRGVIRTTLGQIKQSKIFDIVYFIVGQKVDYDEKDKILQNKNKVIGVHTLGYNYGYALNDMGKLAKQFEFFFDEHVGIVSIFQFKKGTPFMQCHQFVWESFFPKIKEPLLNSKGWHPKDMHISFNDSKDISGEKKHDYIFEKVNVKKYGWKTSTEIVQMLYPFPVVIAASSASKSKDPTNVYFGMTTSEILNYWNTLKEMGTEFHSIIEKYLCYNKKYKGIEYNEEFKLFQGYNNYMKKNGYYPYRVEWVIYSAEKQAVGTPDIVYYSERDKKFIITDIKRSHKRVNYVKVKEHPNLEGIREMKDTIKGVPTSQDYQPFIRYSIQLGIYRKILQSYTNTNFNYVCDKMHVVRMFPGMLSFELTQINPKDFEERIEQIFLFLFD